MAVFVCVRKTALVESRHPASSPPEHLGISITLKSSLPQTNESYHDRFKTYDARLAWSLLISDIFDEVTIAAIILTLESETPLL